MLGELRAFGNNFCAQIIFHALRNLVGSQHQQLVNHDFFQSSGFRLKFFVQFRQNGFVCIFLAAGLDYARIQFLVNDHSAQ